MDWLINPLNISIAIGLFTLALWLKSKNNDEVSSGKNKKRNYESNEKEKKNEMATLERRAQQIIKQHLSRNAPSYEEVKNKHDYTGFTEAYLRHSKNNQTMSTTADYNVMLKLASVDKLRDNNTTFNTILEK